MDRFSINLGLMNRLLKSGLTDGQQTDAVCLLCVHLIGVCQDTLSKSVSIHWASVSDPNEQTAKGWMANGKTTMNE